MCPCEPNEVELKRGERDTVCVCVGGRILSVGKQKQYG